MARLKWSFAESLDPERVRLLSEAPAFSSIVKTVLAEMKVLCGHADPCRDNVRFRRVTYSIELPKCVFDWTFNSANGYRAWFYRSPYEGLRNNAVLLGAIAPALAQFKGALIDSSFAVDSLGSPTAKVWLAEHGNKICADCPGCEGEWSPPQDDLMEIFNGRWEKSLDALAKWGRKAPHLSKLRIFGAFLNEQRDEWTPSRKRHRAQNLHDFGWA
jgi:hypothetical protein